MDSYKNNNNNGNSAVLPVKLDVSVRPVTAQNNLAAFASVTINDCFAVEGLKVVNGKNGLFVNMPSVKDSNGEYKDICKPVTKEFHKQLTEAVLAGYEKAVEKGHESEKSATVHNETQKNLRQL